MDESPKRQKKCALGFDCSGMMQIPGINPGDCENYATCRVAVGLPADETFQIYYHGGYFGVSRTECAQLMLMQRGCPQNLESLGITRQFEQMSSLIAELNTCLQELYYDVYVAPPNSDVCSYNVKRPKGIYQYYKLASDEKIFAPVIKHEQVKVIHLSKKDDPRCVEALRGIERRNKLLQAKNRLDKAISLLRECLPE